MDSLYLLDKACACFNVSSVHYLCSFCTGCLDYCVLRKEPPPSVSFIEKTGTDNLHSWPMNSINMEDSMVSLRGKSGKKY